MQCVFLPSYYQGEIRYREETAQQKTCIVDFPQGKSASQISGGEILLYSHQLGNSTTEKSGHFSGEVGGWRKLLFYINKPCRQTEQQTFTCAFPTSSASIC